MFGVILFYYFMCHLEYCSYLLACLWNWLNDITGKCDVQITDIDGRSTVANKPMKTCFSLSDYYITVGVIQKYIKLELDQTQKEKKIDL